MAQEQSGAVRALVLGAETVAGRVLAAALADAGARVALVVASPDPQAAFAVQRLSRSARGGPLSQAIDAVNEMAVRVMTRQVSKALGGLDLLLFCADLGDRTAEALALASRFAAREMARVGGGVIVIASAATAPSPQGLPDTVRLLTIEPPREPNDAWAHDVLSRLGNPIPP